MYSKNEYTGIKRFLDSDSGSKYKGYIKSTSPLYLIDEPSDLDTSCEEWWIGNLSFTPTKLMQEMDNLPGIWLVIEL